jgi:hypothetical protein
VESGARVKTTTMLAILAFRCSMGNRWGGGEERHKHCVHEL